MLRETKAEVALKLGIAAGNLLGISDASDIVKNDIDYDKVSKRLKEIAEKLQDVVEMINNEG